VQPYGAIGVGLAALVAYGLLRPALGSPRTPSVSSLALSRGQAVFVRGPTGRSLLIVQGRADARGLVDGVADHLAPWEHKLDRVVVLDPGAERALGLTLARYPTDQLTRAGPPLRLDLGAGQSLTVSSIATDGELVVQVVPGASVAEGEPRSGPTTFAARPGSAN
jgi:hypothetical protein